ncbi:hypothetical protein EFM1CSP_19360 [Enterococcus faecium]|nr:hypothetical protein EFM1CSP_19360 [Enterococcus faecium]
MEYLVEFLLQESSQGNQSRRWPEMIRIGLTSFKEHDKLTGKKNNTLYEYAGFLPLVELENGLVIKFLSTVCMKKLDVC